MRTLPVEYLQRADAAEAAHIARALTAVESKVIEFKFEPLKARTFIPVESDDPGAEWTSYVMLTGVGVAKMISSRGQDLPKVNVFRKEYRRKYEEIGAQYDYTVRELRNAEFSSRNGGQAFSLDTSLATACRRAVDTGIDKVGALGSATDSEIAGLETSIGPDVGMLGLLNQPNATTYTPATGAGGSLTWALKTADEILADLNGMVTSVITASREAFGINVILLPVAQHRLISTKRMGDGSDMTVLELFQKQNPGITVDRWNFCKGAGSGSNLDRAVGFQSTEDVIAFKISIDFEQMPVEYRNRVFKTDCIAKTAGVVVRRPIAIVYMDAI